MQAYRAKRVLTSERAAECVERIASERSRAAFVEVFDHFAPRIKAYLMRLGAAPDVAEELTQEAMIILWRKAGLFDRRRSSVATWLFRVARNRWIDHLRRSAGGAPDPDDPALRPPENADPAEGIDALRREARVRAALAALPQEQVALIRLAFFTGMSHSEIAAETGLPLGTVKSRIRLAFARLRIALEADETVEP